VTFADFLAQKGEILDVVAHLKTDDDLARTNDDLSAVIAQLHEHFAIDGSGDIPNVVQQINGLREKLDRQPKIIRKHKFEVMI
jgi:hypothetical protein